MESATLFGFFLLKKQYCFTIFFFAFSLSAPPNFVRLIIHQHNSTMAARKVGGTGSSGFLSRFSSSFKPVSGYQAYGDDFKPPRLLRH